SPCFCQPPSPPCCFAERAGPSSAWAEIGVELYHRVAKTSGVVEVARVADGDAVAVAAPIHRDDGEAEPAAEAPHRWCGERGGDHLVAGTGGERLAREAPRRLAD